MREALAGAVANLQAAGSRRPGRRSTAGDLPTVLADPTQLVQLFQNLIGNALKFRAEGRPPEIRVSGRRRGGEWVIAVADNGIGIEAEVTCRRIFKLGIESRLHGADASTPATGSGWRPARRSSSGTAAASGRSSAGPGTGTTISFTLPAAD